MALLGLVHPAVRRDAHLRSAAVLRIAGAAAADADRKLLSVEDDRGGERGLDALGHAGALTFVHVGADDERELIAADAEGRSVFFPSEEESAYPNRYAALLCDCSSIMPEVFEAAIREAKGPGALPPFRGVSYNASADQLVAMLNIGSISVKTE